MVEGQEDDVPVRLGGVDLRNVSEPSLRHSVGVVTQEVQLYRATVKDNLTFFTDRPEADIEAVLDDVGLGDWIREIGLGTELGPAGQGLSAGEQQLLALARVFLQNPGLVILDEPSSRLDPVTSAPAPDLRGRDCRNALQPHRTAG